MARLRIVTWNCRSGAFGQRLSELAAYHPHVVFLQECAPVDAASSPGVVCALVIRGRKSIALLAPAASSPYLARRVHPGSGRAVVAAHFVEPIPFTAIGIWAQGPDYVEDVLLTLGAHADLIRAGPVVVVGDLNSGSRLGDRSSQTRNHQRVLDTCREVGLVSAYHVFHNVRAGSETQATYFHQFKRTSQWHIDHCLIPRSWTSGLVNVAVVDGRQWARRSDHRPLLVELETASFDSMRKVETATAHT